MAGAEGNPHSNGVPAKPRRQYGAGRSGSVYASKIYKQYGNEASEVVQKNPYRLAHDIFGIGFLTADRIAEKMGFDRQSPERAQAGIIYVLHQCSDEGHVFMPREVLLTKAREILEVDDGILVAALAGERYNAPQHVA